MKLSSKIIKAIAVACVGAFALSGCGNANNGSSSSAPKPVSTSVPDTITAEVAYAGRDFSPSTTSSALAMGGNWHVTEPLYAIDYSTFKVFNALAKGEPQKISDTEYVVTLRDGAKFSDGTPVTAQDVVKSYERTTAKGSLYISMLNFIDSVTAKGENQVDFKLKQAFPMFKQRLALIQIVPASADAAQLKTLPVGSGPWKYTSITDQQVKFDANPEYNGSHKAQTKHMVWNIAVDDTARVTAMQGGKVDVMESVPSNAFKTLQSSGAQLDTVQGFTLPFIMFNTKKAPFDNPKVRQAVLYSIDTNKLINNQMAGQAEPATSFLPKSFPNYHKASTVYTKDVSKAKDLLKDAGVSGPLSFTLYTTDHTWITQLAPQIKNDLAEIGMNVDIKSMASSALYPNITDKANADYSMVLAPGDPSVFGSDPDLLMNWWYGDNAWTKTRTFWNGSDGYKQLHELMDKAIAAKDASARQDDWNKCFDLLSEQVPLYPLFHRKTTTATKKGVFKTFKAIGSTGINLVQAQLSK